MAGEGTEVRVVGRVVPKLMGSRERRMPPEVEGAVAPHRLDPLYPGTEDPSFASWFVVTLTDPAEAEALAGRLRVLPGIEAAYVEPRSAPPA